MARKRDAHLKGDLSLASGAVQSLAATQIDLLVAVDECGSISKAARQIGISYKTAWDRIDTMNNMSDKPLVSRAAGGAHGGGTSLTEFGRQIIDGFKALQEEHALFIRQLGSRVHSLTDVANFVRSGMLKTSARNQFRCKVARVNKGAVNTEIELDTGSGQMLTAIITQDSSDALELAPDVSVIALIKASSVIVSKDIAIATSAGNRLTGAISRIIAGAVNSDITLDLGGGKSVSAIITNNSVSELELKAGDEACAIFNASSVILIADPL